MKSFKDGLKDYGSSFWRDRHSNLFTNAFFATHKIEVNLEVGLNPAGVRRFFEENVFSEPPTINLTPALLKPYTLQYRMIAANIARANQQKTPKKEQVVPYPVFTGKWHGDTCAGPVFDNMMTPRKRGSYPPTFDTTEERNAFFLQICKLLIDGIEKDDGDAKLCENHGNFWECLAIKKSSSSSDTRPFLI